jgi:hypothetical protein
LILQHDNKFSLSTLVANIQQKSFTKCYIAIPIA